MKRIVLVVFFTIGPHYAWSQSSITYTEGPGSRSPHMFPMFAPASIDLDHDHSPDLSFISSWPVCTMDIPTSMCCSSFDVTAPTGLFRIVEAD